MAAPLDSSRFEPGSSRRLDQSMKLLLTTARNRLVQHLSQALAVRHRVVLTDTRPVRSRHAFVPCNLNHDAETRLLVEGMDAIIWSGWTDPSEDVSLRLDRQTRCLYNLLRAASEAGVPRVVQLSSLAVMDRYPADLRVTERWLPWPAEEPPTLAYRLGEIVCREFAREGKLQVVCLRLGSILWKTEHSRSDGVTAQDAVEAVGRSLTAELPGYSVFHIQSEVPGQRYGTERAQRTLGFESTWRPA